VSAVWAPGAGSVEAVVGGASVGMERGEGGWWHLAGEELRPGTRYAFCLDGADPLPDPRSRHQPEGVHGASAAVGPFHWSDEGWRGVHLSSAVIYELHIGTFSPAGTFAGAIERLDHLVDLGVDVVEIMPVAEFPGRRGWGYDGVDLYAPHHGYGGPQGLAALVDACHARGLGVVLDVVYNHLGPAGNYLDRFGPYFTDRYATPWGRAVNFDGPGSDEVRRFFVDNACMWLTEYHVDGLRLDAVHAIVDTSARHILEDLAEAVHEVADATGRARFAIAESDLNDPRLVRPTDVGGHGLDAAWSDDFHHGLHVALTGERSGYYGDFEGLADVAAALTGGWVYRGQPSRHRGRRHGRPYAPLAGSRLVGYLQNHDQVGNRAAGERISALTSLERVKVGAALVLTSPFVPLLFQGEEWAASTPFQYFTDHDPELGRAVSEGRRSEFAAFGWRPEEVPDPQDPDTFARSVLDWTERDRAPHAGMLEWYRRLIDLRRRTPALLDGRLDRVRAEVDRAAGTLVVTRGPVTVAANLGPAPARLAVEPAEVVLASADGVGRCDDGRAVLVPPDSVAVLRR